MKVKKQILFSIIIPCYNCKDVMQRGIASLENQIYKNFEVIFVDDCSTDTTFEFLLDYCNHTNIEAKAIRTSENAGPGNARNVGISIAQGEYIAFMDSDDWYEIDFLKVIDEKLNKADCDVILFDYSRNYQSGKKVWIKCTQMFNSKTSLKEYVALAYDSLCTLVVKTALMKVCPIPSLYNSEDAAIVPVILSMARSISYCHIPFYNYLYRKNSLSTSKNKSIYQGFIDACFFIDEKIPMVLNDEKEFRGIHLVLYGAIYKAMDAGVSVIEVKKTLKSFEQRFPHWQSNPYLTNLPLRKKVFLYFVRVHCFYMVKIYCFLQRILLNIK